MSPVTHSWLVVGNRSPRGWTGRPSRILVASNQPGCGTAAGLFLIYAEPVDISGYGPRARLWHDLCKNP